MRKTMLVGLVLTIAAVVVAIVSSWFDLELEPVALLGVAVGGVLALVPGRSPLMHLAGFAGGFVVAWVGYLVRAAMLPDSTGGRALFVGLVMILAVGIALASMDRIPLWSTLLGAAAMAGAYEYTFAAAIPEAASTSVTAATSLLMATAVGFLAAAIAAPGGDEPAERTHRAPAPRNDDETARFDDMMEKTK